MYYLIIISIICLLISCYLLWYTYKYKSNIDNINNDIKMQNKDLEMENFALKYKKEKLKKDILANTEELSSLSQKLKDLSENVDNAYEEKKELSFKAFENDVLDT